MRYAFFTVLTIFGSLIMSSGTATAKVRVFACEPEWASLSQSLGGDLVDAYSATHATQDPHYIRARPSLIAKMRKADLIICSGAGLEEGWLPVLLQKAGNTNAQPGSLNFLLTAGLVPLLETPVTLDRSMGDMHPQGNPHVHLNPHNIPNIAAAIVERLKSVDDANLATYQHNYETFLARWGDATEHWETQASGLKGRRIITHHKSWTYLIDWLELELVNTLEPKPGIPPNSSHLERLLIQVNEAPVLAIVRSPYAPDKGSKWLSGKTGVPAIVLPFTVGGEKDVTDLFSLFDRTLDMLNGAVDAKS